jgi:hypothetical protein
MADVEGDSHSPLDYHLTICELVSSRLRVNCVVELIIGLLVDDLDDRDIARLLERESGYD